MAETTTAKGVNDYITKHKLYLVDTETIPHNLQRIIANENSAMTTIYCFCADVAPKVPLDSLQQYSDWLQHERLHIIQLPKGQPPQCEASTILTLAYFAGKLAAAYDPQKTQVFVASDNTDLYTVVLWLRQSGFEVESSWPDLESVQCTDDILCAVLRVMQETTPPTDLTEFMHYIRNECKLPPYVSLESVIREMQHKDFIKVHRGELQFELPIFLDALERHSRTRRRRRRHHSDE